MKRAYFASGCFWCVEAIYESVRGVTEVYSGYSGGFTKNPNYNQIGTGRTGHAEAVEVIYDPEVVSFGTLVQVFFGSHDPTTPNRQGPDYGSQYRSIAFYTSEQEREIIQNYIALLEEKEIFSKEIEFTYALKWSQQNREITNFLLKNNLNSKLITYHDLATKPENTIKTITEWLNLQYENTQLNYWAHQHHGTQKPNYDWVKEKKGQFIDLRWKNELAEEAATKIARNKQVVQLISDLKLTLNINGLEN